MPITRQAPEAAPQTALPSLISLRLNSQGAAPPIMPKVQPFGADHFIDSVITQESGGNYAAVGKPNLKGQKAYGKYQVMDFNIPTWTKESLGRAYTPDEYLKDPKAQDALSRARLTDLFTKHGPEDAAAIWFSGGTLAKNRNKKDATGTTVQQYVDSVMSRFNKASLAKGAQTVFDIIENTFGAPAFAASGGNPLTGQGGNVPRGFSDQVTEATKPIFGDYSPVMGMAAGFMEPLPGGGASKGVKLLKDIHPDDARFLVNLAEHIQKEGEVSGKLWDRMKNTLKYYGMETPTTQKKAADFIMTANISAEGKAMNTALDQSLKSSKLVKPQALAEKFARQPDSITLYRGENASNKGGIFFSPDKADTKTFGSSVIQGKLPKDSKIYLSQGEQDFKDVMNEMHDIPTEQQIHEYFWKKGFDAIVGTDPMTGKLNVIVNPKHLGNFK